MKSKQFIILFTGILFSTGIFCQEILTGLQFNEAVKFESSNLSAEKKACNCAAEKTESLQLPFFDDFTTSSVYANESKWENSRSVFINKDFPFFPPNLSAATFDAIDSEGAVYSNAVWIPFEADVMTSQPIRLDSIFSPVVRKLTPADSVYLSFFYQPQGVGDDPEPWDTLMLEFGKR
jgi:hypothetical protein